MALLEICPHCSQPVSFTAEQLANPVACPHCGSQILGGREVNVAPSAEPTAATHSSENAAMHREDDSPEITAQEVSDRVEPSTETSDPDHPSPAPVDECSHSDGKFGLLLYLAAGAGFGTLVLLVAVVVMRLFPDSGSRVAISDAHLADLEERARAARSSSGDDRETSPRLPSVDDDQRTSDHSATSSDSSQSRTDSPPPHRVLQVIDPLDVPIVQDGPRRPSPRPVEPAPTDDTNSSGARPPVVVTKPAPVPVRPIDLGGPEAHPIVGQDVNLMYVVRGKPRVMENITIVAVEEGAAPGSFAELHFRMLDEPASKRPRMLPSEDIVRIVAGDKPYDVRYDRTEQIHRLIDVEEHRQEVARKLRSQGEHFWPQASPEEQAESVAEYKLLLEKVNSRFGGKMRTYETEYFLFCSDLAEAEARLSIRYLTAMYDKLCEMFGIMPGENIWRGKGVVVAFHNESDFHAFEKLMMGNPNPEGSAGVHHGFTDGRSIISCKRGTNPSFYRVVLVHETVHGFLHRYRSSVNVKSWLNEGIADWIAGFVVPDSDEVRDRQRAARKRLLASRTLGPEFFEVSHISGDAYGTASDMTDMLLTSNPAAFRLFLDGIKEGISWQESLLNSYGVTSDQLAELYFRNRVVPNR